MSQNIAKMAVQISADGTGFKSALDKSAKDAQSWSKRISQFLEGATSGGLLAGLGKVGLAGMGLQVGGELFKKLAGQFGFDKLTDVTQGLFDSATGGLSKKLRKAGKGLQDDILLLTNGDDGDLDKKIKSGRAYAIKVARERYEAQVEAATKAKEAFKDFQGSIDQLTTAMKREISVAGKMNEELDLMAIRAAGAAKGLKENPFFNPVGNVDQMMKALKQHRKDVEDAEAANRIGMATRGPDVGLAWDADLTKRLVGAGRLTKESANRWLQQQQIAAIPQMLEGMKGDPNNRLAEALGRMVRDKVMSGAAGMTMTSPTMTRGSAEEGSFRAQFEQRREGLKTLDSQMLDIYKQMLDAEKKQAQELAKLGKQFQDKFPVFKMAAMGQ